MNRNDMNSRREAHKTSRILWYFYIMFLLLSVIVIFKMVHIQFIWEPDPNTVDYFRPKKYQQTTKPERGSIFDHNDKLLAISTPMYQIYMDCTVMKEAYQDDGKEGAEKEKEWRQKAGKLSEGLAKILNEPGKNASYYNRLIINGRLSGKKYVQIAKNLDHDTYLKLMELPLYNERNSNKSGLIVEKTDTRQYPYDELARRVIGYVKNNDDIYGRKQMGVEGNYDYILHGNEGRQWMRVTDNRGRIRDNDSTVVKVRDGQDVRMTIDIDIQDIADRALRKQIEENNEIEGGCAVVMDVKTGAVRAMVNLKRDRKGKLGENFNMAIGHPGEPGSVFKTATLMTLLEDDKITLDTRIPTNHGVMPNVPVDRYIVDYERNNNAKEISVLKGFEISSNYVFRRLVMENYGDNPEKFINRLYEYRMNEIVFDLEETGSSKPRIPDPAAKGWSPTDLAQAAIGYSVRVTPLQVATFYNAIANKGKMMKPYIVEAIEEYGETEKEFDPVVLHGSICSKATADTLTRALKMVTLEGTATKLKNARCTVAGKTGTARMVLTPEERGKGGSAYESVDGLKKHQGTFVGFFPAEDPQYTAIVVVYSKLTKKNYYGGNLPALTFKEMVDNIYSLDTRWGNEYEKRSNIPDMSAGYINVDKDSGVVPDVEGMGLKDALYSIENSGYRCRYQGIGHVVRQSPAAGSSQAKGGIVNIVLK